MNSQRSVAIVRSYPTPRAVIQDASGGNAKTNKIVVLKNTIIDCR